MEIDLEAAQRHLRHLDPAADGFIFAAFSEGPGIDGPPRQLMGCPHSLANSFSRLQARGYGIFVAVNAFRGLVRRKAELVRIRAIIADMDGPQKTSWPLKPSLRIRSSPGRGQVYWLADRDDPPSGEEAEKIQRSIAISHGSDGKATDVARVLRLGGSWHLKHHPCRVEILDDTGCLYSRAELLAAFPPLPAPPSPSQARPIAIGDRYLDAAICGELDRLGQAQPGTRNDTLNRAAYALAQLGLSDERIASLLAPTAAGIGLPSKEIGATIRSGAAAGMAKPRETRSAT